MKLRFHWIPCLVTGPMLTSSTAATAQDRWKAEHETLAPYHKVMLDESDVVSFHNHTGASRVRPAVKQKLSSIWQEVNQRWRDHQRTSAWRPAPGYANHRNS